MRVFSDLHLHSRYSRATSHDLNIDTLERYAKIKGLTLLGTGDFTHPLWLNELKQKLKEENGILKTSSEFPFILQAEISNIYTQDNKLRKVHNVILAPSFEIVEQINELLGKKGNLGADGRPIFGKYSCVELADDLMKISRDIEIIPSHCWTPWFSIFGSMSGFDSVEECFQDRSNYIHALETGMSSDPAMNWRLSKLDKYTLVSNSDSHSFWPWRMGRECNIFDLEELTYNNIVKAIRTNEGFLCTIETSPSYGKYHFDGHRLCNFSCSPEEAVKIKNICPVCGRALTIGVAHRVNELADRPKGFVLEKAHPFRILLPLHEIISAIMKTSMSSKKVWQEYNKLLAAFNDEFNVLLNAPHSELRKLTDSKIADMIMRNREGKINVKPGFDGEYGVAIIETDEQKRLF
jgi:uncharacterized protein (TIGR00375 family)